MKRSALLRKTRLKPRADKQKRGAAKRRAERLAKKRLIREQDDAARQRVFERDDHRCVRCHRPDGIQWAHIFSRRHKSIRWEADNALTLCAGCHRFFWHGEPALAMPWFQKNWPERYERILAIFNAGGAVNPAAGAAEREE